MLSINEGDRPNVKSVGDAAQQLRWHRLDVEARCLAATGGDVAQALVGAAHELNADLLAMGAYDDSREREVIFGGATRYVLRGVDLPVLLSY